MFAFQPEIPLGFPPCEITAVFDRFAVQLEVPELFLVLQFASVLGRSPPLILLIEM